MFKPIPLAVLHCIFILPIAHAQTDEGNSPQVIINNANWTATDDLGRILPTYSETGGPRSNRWVGLFYFLCHRSNDTFGRDYNVTEFLKLHPGFWPWNATSQDGPTNPTWYWGEPLFGYYTSDDPWVVRKHLAMIADAGVDFIFLDLTNNAIFEPELKNLLEAAHDLKSKGIQVPRIVCFVHTNPEPNIEKLYSNWYQPGKYDDLWFRWKGKPLMMAPCPSDRTKLSNPALLSSIQNYFTWRPAGWPDEVPAETHTRWRYAVKDPISEVALDASGKPEAITVCKSMGGPVWNNMQTGGVSCQPGFIPEYDDQCLSKQNGRGLYFQYEFNRIKDTNAPILLVTGWNEWTAKVWERPGVVFMNKTTKKGEGYFVDEFNMDFNRDVEPMKDGYRDNYYWQLVSNLRRFKGMAAPDPTSPPKSIPMNGDFGAWADVHPIYQASGDITVDRDANGTVAGSRYINRTARNAFASAQVTSDIEDIYFHVRTVMPISPGTDRNWMMLLIDADANSKTGWHGYDLLINRERNGNKCTVEANVDGSWTWKKIGEAKIDWSGNDMEIAVPRNLIANNESDAATFDFKWADNIPDSPDIMDFYSIGTVAPNTRFNYSFKEYELQ